MGEPRALRVVFLGNDEWSVPSLEALARSSHDVVLAVTRVPRPGRRGAPAAPTPVAEAARRSGVAVAEVETVREGPGLDRIVSSRPDVLVVVAYGEILPPDVLAVPRVAPVNVHFSLLPSLRGASPVQTALLRGLEETGVTTIVMDEGVDTGPVLGRRAIPIEPDDDAGSLGERLATLGGDLVAQTIDELSSGDATPTPQDDSMATFAPKLRPQDRLLVWSEPPADLVNRVRALSPEPAATTAFRGAPLKVFRAEAVPDGGEPGTIAAAGPEELVVGTGSGGLRLLEVAPPGGRRMTASEFVRGHRPVPGERLE